MGFVPVSRELDRRLGELERRQSRRTTSREAIYSVIREGEPRPDVVGPIYRLVSPRPERNRHA